MKKYLLPSKTLFLFYILFSILNQAISISVALYLSYVIDSALSLEMDNLIQAIFVGVIFISSMLVIEIIRRFLHYKNIYLIMTKIKSDIFYAITKKSIAEFNETRSGSYISLLNNEISNIENNYVSPFFLNLQMYLMFIFAALLILFINPILGIITVLLTTLPLLLPKIFASKVARKQGDYMNKLSVLNEKIKDFLDGFEVVKTFNIEKKVNNIFFEKAKEARLAQLAFNKTNGIIASITNFVNIGVQFTVFLIAGFFAVRGDITIGSIVAITQLSGNLVTPIMYISQGKTQMKSIAHTEKKIVEILKTSDENENKNNLDYFNKSIKIENLSFSYDHESVIRNINYIFEKGKKYAIVGNSGSGKSTLAKLIMGYYNNYNGTILIDDLELKNISKESLYKKMSLVHQNVFLLDDTLQNNITLYKNYSNDDYIKAITSSGLENVQEAKSGGEKQRVAIARALISGSEILLTDEATASLDPQIAFEIEQTILKTHTTVILVTHRYSKENLEKCDEILVMKDGQIEESGSFNELYNKKEYFYSLYNVSQQ